MRLIRGRYCGWVVGMRETADKKIKPNVRTGNAPGRYPGSR